MARGFPAAWLYCRCVFGETGAGRTVSARSVHQFMAGRAAMRAALAVTSQSYTHSLRLPR